MEPKFYICKKCGKIVAMVKGSPCDTFCCGEPMEEIIPNGSDGAREKHVPVFKVEGNVVTVRVGEVDHPMIDAHYIEWVMLESKEGNQRKTLKPGDEPVVKFSLVPGDEVVAVYAYCNLHSLFVNKK